jgi:hypothetical protein
MYTTIIFPFRNINLFRKTYIWIILLNTISTTILWKKKIMIYNLFTI